jgi:ferredoxin-nitrate reductase
MRARGGGTRSGEVFVPFHFGYWDHPGSPRAANELTIYSWDAVSKQPHFKYAAVKLEKVSQKDAEPKQAMGSDQRTVETSASHLSTAIMEAAAFVKQKGRPRPHLADYLGILDESEKQLAKAFERVKKNHPAVPDTRLSPVTTWCEW